MATNGMAGMAQIVLPGWLTAVTLPAAPVSDEAAMWLALDLSAQNVSARTGGPFGAAIRADASGELIGLGVNLSMTSGNPLLHAETVAISIAGGRLADPGGVTLFTSCAPCIMCLGASHWAGIRRIVSAAAKADAEALGFSEGAGTPELRAQMAARGVTFEDGLLREEGAAILRRYAGQGGVIYGPKS